MTIETELNEGDKVFFINDLKKVVESTVRGFSATLINGERLVTYLCKNDTDSRIHIKVPESDAYPTKESLLASL